MYHLRSEKLNHTKLYLLSQIKIVNFIRFIFLVYLGSLAHTTDTLEKFGKKTKDE